MICSFLEPINQGLTFSDWPLHLTLASWFELENKHFSGFYSLTQQVTQESLPISLTTTEPIRLGFKKTLVGLAIEPNTELYKLHDDLADLIARYAQPNNRNYTQDKFLPHITLRKNAILLPGSELTVSRLYVVTKLDNHYRHVSRLFKP